MKGLEELESQNSSEYKLIVTQSSMEMNGSGARHRMTIRLLDAFNRNAQEGDSSGKTGKKLIEFETIGDGDEGSPRLYNIIANQSDGILVMFPISVVGTDLARADTFAFPHCWRRVTDR
jgi:hypothetical protein